MSRTLGFYPFIIAAITVILILVLSLFNIYLLVKCKRSRFTICIHIVSLFALFALIFHMISVAVFVHSLSERYRLQSQISFLLAGISILGGIISALVLGQKHSFRKPPHNIPDALSSIEDLVFIVDRDGVITNINHPEKYHTLFGDMGTMKQLLFFIEEHCDVGTKDLEALNNLSETSACEIYFKRANIHGIFQLSPIVIGNTRLGYTAVLKDVSDIRISEKILQEQNEYLKQANGRLSNYIKAAGVLEAEKERLQILEQVQDTLITDIEHALFSIRSVKKHCFEDGTYKIAMKELAAQLRQIYQKVRSTVGQIAGKGVKS